MNTCHIFFLYYSSIKQFYNPQELIQSLRCYGCGLWMLKMVEA